MLILVIYQGTRLIIMETNMGVLYLIIENYIQYLLMNAISMVFYIKWKI